MYLIKIADATDGYGVSLIMTAGIPLIACILAFIVSVDQFTNGSYECAVMDV